jgi:hypothetical protein
LVLEPDWVSPRQLIDERSMAREDGWYRRRRGYVDG